MLLEIESKFQPKICHSIKSLSRHIPYSMIVFGQFSHQNLNSNAFFAMIKTHCIQVFYANSNEPGPIFKITTNELICNSNTFCCFLVLCENFNHTNIYSIIEWKFRVEFILPNIPK